MLKQVEIYFTNIKLKNWVMHVVLSNKFTTNLRNILLYQLFNRERKRTQCNIHIFKFLF